MIGWLLHRGVRAFGRRYDYDAGYMSDVVDISRAAGLRLSAFPLMSQYRGPKTGRDVWAGALLASTLDGDCGPCAQLVVDMAREAGADAAALRACVEGRAGDAGGAGLGFRFAQAAIAGDLAADELRELIVQRFGPKTMVAASFAAASGRLYPVLKRGLGHGAACSRLQFGAGELVLVRTR